CTRACRAPRAGRVRMGFDDFHGNRDTVGRLRGMLLRDRFPHGVILSGADGSGKYTLAMMLAKCVNCLAPPAGELPDFCGRCSNCTRIAQADDLDARFAEAVEAREALRETDKKETRILVQTHPDVLVIPPDPPQLLIKVDQVRHVIASIYYRPSDGRRRVYIFTAAAFMKEAANALLKVLEEPPEFATLFLLAQNPGALLPTIRSRSISFALTPLPLEEIERQLAKAHPEWKPAERLLVARLSEGAVGRARNFDLKAYLAARQDALTLLSTAVHPDDHSALFRATETYRAGAEGKEKADRLLSAAFGLLEDLLLLKSNAPDLVRNVDLAKELGRMAATVDFGWISRASQLLNEVETGMRRNLLRSLSLDAMVAGLEREAG
ncbi:MAG: ATP-binding protein, partial [Candidatus Korobacteraceae bacterium]